MVKQTIGKWGEGLNLDEIQKNALFKNMTLDSLESILNCSKSIYKKYQRGEMIFREEERAQFLFVLLKGRVIIAKQLISGKKNILYEVKENHIFGEHYVFGEEHIYQYNAQAASDVELLGIPWQFFFGYCSKDCDHHRQLIRNMLDVLSTKGWMAIQKVNVISPPSLKQRISIWLMNEMDDQGIVPMQMDRQELADYLGVARPSLSRSLMKMQAEGLIEVHRDRIIISDIEKIEKLCD